ncbi:MAG TPA: ThuA domain-containing protein [Acidobacteriaceae bacterium]|jgi:hypothetical protein
MPWNRRQVVGGLSAFAASSVLPSVTAQSGSTAAKQKRVLAWGDVQTAYQHDSVSHALATMERLGREHGFSLTIRTDSQLITKSKVWGTGRYAAPPAGERGTNAKNLNDFDAVFFYGIGEGALSSAQKADLLSFVHDDGKGFVGAHTAIDAFFTWPEFGEMMGGYFDEHPWGVTTAPVIVERPEFPGWRSLAPRTTMRDEFYQVSEKPYSRNNVDVIARLDVSKLDMNAKNVRRKDADFPVAWAKTYGQGNVFWSTLGHAEETWDDPHVQAIYVGALRWALGLETYMPRPHPKSS